MLPLAQLKCEERQEIRRFHLWYMEAAKAGLSSFTAKVPAEYFSLPEDAELPVEFHDMYRLLRRDDLDVAQVTLFALAMAYVSKVSGERDLYLSPMHISERCIVGYEIPNTHPDLKDSMARQRDRYRQKKLEQSKLAVAMYIYGAMKNIRGNGCILAAYHYGHGLTGHWIAFCIYPQDGRACIFDSLRNTNKQGYKHFESCLKFAYKQFLKDPDHYDRRSNKFKAKHKDRIKIRHEFPCAKQPEGTLLCGYYVCEYLRACRKFSHSWRQLKKGMNWWMREQVNQHCFNQTVADICKFVTDQCVHEGRIFFNPDSPLGGLPEYEHLRKWSTMLRVPDYSFPDLFGLGKLK